MPVKKGKRKPKKNIDRKVKKQIKETVEKLPKLISEEMKDKNEPQNIPYYNEPSYKKKKMMMWVIVAIFFLIILVMWIINANSVFYDFNKSLQNNDSLNILDKGKETLQKDSEGGLQKILDDFNTALDEKVNEQPVEEKNTVKLEDLINAVNNFTSTTTSTTSNERATSTQDIATSTEEAVE